MERKNLIGFVITLIGRSGRFNRAASWRSIRLAPLLLVAVMLAAVAAVAAVAVLAETSNPAQTAHAHEDLLPHDHGNVVCSSPPAEHCPTYDYFAGEPTTHWATTITVGDLTTTISSRETRHQLGYFAEAGSLGSSQFTYDGPSYSIDRLFINRNISNNVEFSNVLVLDIEPTFPSTFSSNLTLELDGQRFLLSDARRESGNLVWDDHGLTWSENQSVAVKLVTPPLPNAYGYRTIWSALMTPAANPSDATIIGYFKGGYGASTNNLIVTGRDETVTIGTEDQPQYPWIGYEIEGLTEQSGIIQIDFPTTNYPPVDEAADWTLVLGGGVELPFPDGPLHAATPYRWQISYTTGWAAGDQVLVSIRNDELQNRVGQTAGDTARNRAGKPCSGR